MDDKKVIKVCLGEWKNQSRDEREMLLLQEMNFEVEVISKSENQHFRTERINNLLINKLPTKNVKIKSKSLNKIYGAFSWIRYIRKKNAYILTCHDLIALLFGYISNLFKKNKAILVYDSHEFELGRNANRSKFQKSFIYYLEKFLIKKSKFMIVVNDIIADRVKEIYKLKTRPIVVRNIPEYWNLDEEQIRNTRKELLEEFNISNTDNPFIIMYHGAIANNRGIEELLKVISIKSDIMCIILGNGEEKYILQLKELSKELGVENRVLFRSAVKLKDLYKYVGAVNVGMITIPGKCESYYYMLPNKFFENIQSLTPVIVSDFPEIGKIVEEYNIGIKVNPENIDEIVNAINKMQKDKYSYSLYKENLIKAKNDLCWQNEKLVLVDAYMKLIDIKDKEGNEYDVI